MLHKFPYPPSDQLIKKKQQIHPNIFSCREEMNLPKDTTDIDLEEAAVGEPDAPKHKR